MSDFYFRPFKRPYMRGHVEQRYSRDEHGRLKFTSGGNVLSGPGERTGESGAPWRGFDPTKKGRHWAIPGFLAEQMPKSFEGLGTLAKLDALHAAGLVEIVPDTAWPTPVRFLREGDGDFLSDIWAYQPYTQGTVHGTEDAIDEDVAWLGPTAPERVGFETQKPIGLLERIIKLSCPEGGLILDPFCGCGTTVEAAERLGHSWIGIDIAIRAIDVIKDRLDEAFPAHRVWDEIGEPCDIESAARLAETNPYDFQWWAIRRLGAMPPKGEKKKGGDRGIDGEMKLRDVENDQIRRVIVSVKGGRNMTPDMVKSLKSTVDIEKADYGILLLMHEPSAGMRAVARDCGTVPWSSVRRGQKLQHRIIIVTAAELLSGRLDLPGVNVTPRSRSSPPPAEPRKGETLRLPGIDPTPRPRGLVKAVSRKQTREKSVRTSTAASKAARRRG